jgi:hypothetical protein
MRRANPSPPAQTEPNSPRRANPTVAFRSPSCGIVRPGGLLRRAGLPPPPQAPAPSEHGARADRTQSPAPSEPERRRRANPSVRLWFTYVRLRAGRGRGCPTSNRLPSTFQRAPYIIVIPGHRVLRIRGRVRDRLLARRPGAGRPGLKLTRDPPRTSRVSHGPSRNLKTDHDRPLRMTRTGRRGPGLGAVSDRNSLESRHPVDFNALGNPPAGAIRRGGRPSGGD